LKLPLRRLSTLSFALLALLALAPDGSAEAESPSSSASDRSAARPAADSLADLMASFAASRGVRARFIETRHLSILMTPIESAGMLYFEPPDVLVSSDIETGLTFGADERERVFHLERASVER